MNRKEHHENRRKEQFWIDRNGKSYKYKGKDVDEIASLHGVIATDLYPDSNRPTDILMNLGWVMVGSTVYSCPIIHKEPTQAQINALDKLGEFNRLCILENNSYPNYAKKMREL